MKVLLPDSLPLSTDLPEGAEGVTYAADRPIPEEHLDAEALVVWGVGGSRLTEHAERLTALRLVQGLSAGPDALLKAGFGEDVAICGGAGLHSKTVTEHALALTLALVCRLPQAAAAQSEHRWADELGGVRPLHPEGPTSTLIDANVLVWGFGAIGQHLAPVLQALGARVRGVARSAGERAGFEVITEDDLDTALPETDVLIMILPADDETDDALDARRLGLLGRDAFVVNVGRGTTVDERALDAALREGTIAGAAIDVTAVEPLPADWPLWTAPNLVLTPHAAGGRPVGADDLIARNVRAFLTGDELANRVR